MASVLIGNIVTKKVTIASGDSLSNAVDAMGMVLIGIELPALWTTSNITFVGTASVAHRDTGAGDYKVICDEDNNVITWTGVAQNQILLGLSASPPIFGLLSVKVSSTTPQAASRILTLMFAVPNP